MRLLIDMDGVLSDFDGAFLKCWRELHPDKFYVPLEERTTFYVKEQYPDELKPLASKIIRKPGFFRDMPPVIGGKEALTKMDEMGFEVFICTSPLAAYQNCVLEKFEWVDEHLGGEWVNRIILTKDKTLVKADYIIDDKPEIKGVEDMPSWEHILYDCPYNKGISKRRITWANWKSILDG